MSTGWQAPCCFLRLLGRLRRRLGRRLLLTPLLLKLGTQSALLDRRVRLLLLLRLALAELALALCLCLLKLSLALRLCRLALPLALRLRRLDLLPLRRSLLHGFGQLLRRLRQPLLLLCRRLCCRLGRSFCSRLFRPLLRRGHILVRRRLGRALSSSRGSSSGWPSTRGRALAADSWLDVDRHAAGGTTFRPL